MGKNLSLKIKSDRTEILKFEKVLEDINSEFGLEHDRFINCQIAVSEALVNAIVHGNKENPDKSVYISIDYDNSVLEIRIKDEGKGFNMEEIPDPTKSDNLLKEHGRGLYIIKSLVDKFECNSSERGTEFVITIEK
ncbi:MAG: ATP-binding protein [Ignavibacteriae bacterium]|nr:ATP-binding protein [Ignavibacteriota bacterium]